MAGELTDPTLTYYSQNASEYVARANTIDLSPVYDRFEPLLPASAIILDLGCGGGRDTGHFASLGHRVIAMDPCNAMLNEAQRRTPPELSARVRYVVAGAPHLPLKEASCSAIWACASLLHLPRRTMPRALAECLRVLCEGGILSVTVKQGMGEGINDGRRFTYWTMHDLKQVAVATQLKILAAEEGRSLDGRDTIWLHILARKV